MTKLAMVAALLLGAAWLYLRRKPPMTPWPLYPPEGDDGLLPIDPSLGSPTYGLQPVDPVLLEWLRLHLAEGERQKAANQFVDMGYDGCKTCERARLRDAWLGEPVRR